MAFGEAKMRFSGREFTVIPPNYAHTVSYTHLDVYKRQYGTLYSREELAALSKVCRENHLPLYVDGARLAYACLLYTSRRYCSRQGL